MPYIHDLMNQSLLVVVTGVFAVLAVASELGFLAGRWLSHKLGKNKASDDDVDNNVSTITNSALGLLALFLGFTFSSAMDHFEKNREAVTNEATAIAAAYQVINLQPEPFKNRLLTGLGQYIDIRLKVADLPSDPQAIRQLQQAGRQAQKQLWATAESLTEKLPNSPLLESLTDALNDLVAAEKTRTENLLNGVPNGLFMPVALFLLFNGVLMGLSLGEGTRRHALLSWGLYFLVALAVGIIVDLDRPLKGFINVDQQAMTLLKDNL